MSVVMVQVPSSTPVATEPGKGDPRFQIDSSKNRGVVSIKTAQVDTLSKRSDTCILECAPLKWNVANRPERDEAGNSISNLPTLGKRKEPSSPLDDLLDDSSESSRADSPLRPRKVARTSHAPKNVASPTPREPLLGTSSSSAYSCPCSKPQVI